MWRKPVDVEIHGPGHYRTIRNARQAAECLLRRWPVSEGSAYSVAKRAVLMELEGGPSSRSYFIAAAKEAGMMVRGE